MTVSASGQPGFSRPAGRPVPQVLVVEDQPQLLRALQINLRARQYDVATATTGRDALAVAAASPPDAMILDLGLPDVDGTEVIVAFRGWSRAPIIVLSGRTSPGDKIGALDAGADDYVTKPFAMGELLARLRAALRRDEVEAGQDRPYQATIGQWVVDSASHQVTRTTDPSPADPGPPPQPGSAGEGSVVRVTWWLAESTTHCPIVAWYGRSWPASTSSRRSAARSRASSSPIANGLVT